MMELFTGRKWKLALHILFFVLAVGLTYFLVPRQEKFDRQFEIGRPWVYELLTAPMDFPIYKLEGDLKAERDTIMKYHYVPYFKMDNAVSAKMRESVADMEIDGAQAKAVRNYLSEKLGYIYGKGIMSLESHAELEDIDVRKVRVIDEDSHAREVAFSELFTIRSAYDYIIKGGETLRLGGDKTLKRANIESLLQENVKIDAVKSDQVKNELINSVSLTQGMVQAGEKIIDRGEVVSKDAYKILRSLEIMSDNERAVSTTVSWQQIVGCLLVIAIMYLLLGCYFYLFRPKVFNSSSSVIFMLLLSVGILALTSSVVRYTSISVYIVPFALLPLMVRVFFDSRTALFLHLITVLLASIMVENKFDFLILQVAAGMTAVSSLKDMNSRSQLVSSAIFIFLTYLFVFIGLELIKGVTLAEFHWGVLVIFFINAAALLFAYGLIYICEKIFGFLSSVTLIELSNVNNSILMDFSEKAPGTFQHALQVSNLAVEVAKKLNANSLLVRTGALYHDIGKMFNPMMFTENQTGGINPLSEMPSEQAAQIIITHVTAGVKMAEKAGLPSQVVDFIRTHHGMSKTRYFYNSYKNKFPDKEIDESIFTYPGPLPFTVEMAIVMMADVVEATSRSLPDHEEATIDNMVDNLINGLIADGQFKNAPISFRDVETAKTVFKEKLKNIYHSRISYPELKKRR